MLNWRISIGKQHMPEFPQIPMDGNRCERTMKLLFLKITLSLNLGTVSSSTGCSDSQYFEELYNYYTTEKAWHLCDPDAEKVFKTLRNAGVKLAVVSNFDTRLRPVLRALNCDYWFDVVAVSAEVEAEKPNPTIFIKACELLGVKPEDAVHVGDDRRNDLWGARDAGCDAWLWGSDVHSFKEVAQRIGVRV
ncbi:Haloacid dehalogenase-like hydrolase domain-containing protein 3 [Camellia lanceoleosa]|uniref:Haloacid dehalogenase-like hydrolase domain-containing protein 3 n=1 Tax=Camellia lanceoleosa TaxID=1840588 RepID=A0ACC0FZW8_9ERIC|nr:Haloacid dehalogenase-like hydrolase domain-containing protein 3 [Camellia lanceoleosa]